MMGNLTRAHEACKRAGCHVTDLQEWMARGWVRVLCERGGPIFLTDSEVADLIAFAALMKRPQGEIASALLRERRP